MCSSTGETILLAGDSAGGNLLLGAAMKCIELGMRPPDAMFLAYVPMIVEFTISPARLLCIMDPMLPFGFMMRCLRGETNIHTYSTYTNIYTYIHTYFAAM